VSRVPRAPKGVGREEEEGGGGGVHPTSIGLRYFLFLLDRRLNQMLLA
jgi:hypothetical protein